MDSSYLCAHVVFYCVILSNVSTLFVAEPGNVVAVLISSEFLKMQNLVSLCQERFGSKLMYMCVGVASSVECSADQ